MSTQNKCPFCKSELVSLVLPSNPPQYRTYCPNCKKYEESNFGQQGTLQDTVQDTQNGIATFGESNSGVTARIIYELVTSGRFSKEDSIKIIEANIADARKEVIDRAVKMYDRKYQEECKRHEIERETPTTMFHDVLATLKEERV